MRQTHAGGDELFVDYAGDAVPVIIDRLTGKTRPAQIFVAVLGASNFTGACPRAGFRPDPWADWTVERIRREAVAIGPATAALCELILERRPHSEQGFRSCLGIVRLIRPFGTDRREAAAIRAIEIGTFTYGSVRSILDNKLDRQAGHKPTAKTRPILHPNIRGSRYDH
jgi:transposase